MNNQIERHGGICEELNKLYAKKNADYGDSFHKTFEDEGWAMVRIRLRDKFERVCSLTRQQDRKVADETLRDTLIDLANYSIMAVMELDEQKQAEYLEELRRKEELSKYAVSTSTQRP